MRSDTHGGDPTDEPNRSDVARHPPGRRIRKKCGLTHSGQLDYSPASADQRPSRTRAGDTPPELRASRVLT
ncbi:MAG: hypothetical protein JJ992_17670, partial [Planctomycetes bacterium]|nr:hypothetical protein [Planctomycetota bacterium]